MVNPDKFQVILLDKRLSDNTNIKVKIGNNNTNIEVKIGNEKY